MAKVAKDGTVKCPVKDCDKPADVLANGQWTCVEHLGGE